MSEAFPFFVTGIEEIGGGVGGVVSAIGANIEGFGWDGEPCEISDHCRQSCNVSQVSSLPVKPGSQ